MKSWKRPLIGQTLYGLATLALATVSVLYMSRRAFGDYDSRFDYAMGSNSLSDRSWFLGFMSNPLTGLQSIDQATLRWLEPHSLLLIWLGSPWGVVIAATMTFVIVGLSCNYLLRTIGFTATQSRWTALIVAGNTVGGEFVGLSGIDLYRLTPSKSTMLAGAYVLTALICDRSLFQGKSLSKKVFSILMMFLLSIWLSVVHTHYLPMVAPFIMVVCVVVLLTQLWDHRRGMTVRLVSLSLLVVAWFAVVARFAAGMYANAAITQLPKEPTQVTPSGKLRAFMEALFPTYRNDILAFVFCILILAGLLLSSWTRSRGEIKRAVLLVTSVLFLLSIVSSFRRSGGNFPIKPSYVAWVFFPLLMAEVLATFTRLFNYWTSLVASISSSLVRRAIRTTSILTLVTLSSLVIQEQVNVFIREWRVGIAQIPGRNSSDLSSYLHETIAITSAQQEFRGRIAFINASDSSYEIDFPELAMNQIPTIHNQGHFQSAAFVWFIETLFRDGLPLSNVKNNYPFSYVSSSALRMVGVRYLAISDGQEAWQKLHLTSLKQVGRFEGVSLVEVDSPNVDGIQLTKISSEMSLKNYLMQVRQNEIESGEFFVDREVARLMTPKVLGSRLFQSSLEYTKSDLHITAQSSGFTVIVLPVEYSNCLELSSQGSLEDVSLFPVNGVLTGLRFNESISTTIKFRTGPLKNSDCRLKDLRYFNKFVLQSGDN